jgi:hypothetical protein
MYLNPLNSALDSPNCKMVDMVSRFRIIRTKKLRA